MSSETQRDARPKTDSLDWWIDELEYAVLGATRAYSETAIKRVASAKATIRFRAAQAAEATCPQAPIAKIRIGADGDIEFAGIYAPGLPPGTEHDVYLDDGASPVALTDEQIVEIRDRLLPSQRAAFDCIAFARAVLAAAGAPKP